MDYKKIYDQIIENRLKNKITKKTTYVEKHHIIPRCLNGSNHSSNLVNLTAREHFVCHLLLAEMFEKGTYEWYKLNHALFRMCHGSKTQKRYFNSRMYEHKREDFKKAISWSQSGEKNSQYGKKRSEETREKIKKAVNTSLGKTDNLNKVQRKKDNRKKEIETYTINGVFFGKQRRNKILQVFSIDITNNPIESIEKVKTYLESLYVTQKLSTVEIGKKLNSDDETIRNYLKLFKINLRSLSESIKNAYNRGCSSEVEH